jgi:protein-S-isoprenylcysteine O-methyltransferase Ste14
MMSAVNTLFNHPGLRSFLVRMRVPLAIAIAAVVIAYADLRWLWPALAVSMAGELIQLWCFATLDKNSSLACRGPYAIVRNPMYLGRFFILGGALMLLGQPWLLVLYAVVYWFYMVNRVGREERRLREVLGAPYAEYCAGTSRFLPGAPYRGEPVLVWDWALFRQNHGWQNFAGTAAFWIAAIVWLATRAGGAG